MGIEVGRSWPAYVVRRRAARTLYAAAMAVVVAHVVAIAFGCVGSSDIAFFFTFVLGPSSLVMTAACIGDRWRLGKLRRDADGLAFVRGKRAHAIARVDGGIVVPPIYTDPRSTTRLELSLGDGRTVVVETGSEADSHALLELAGVDAAHATHRLHVAPGRYLVTYGCVVMLGVVASLVAWSAIGAAVGIDLGSIAGACLLLVVLGIALAGAASTVREPAVVVGTDGIAIRGVIGRWFVPFAEVGSVSWNAHALVVSCRDGRSVRAWDLAKLVASNERHAILRRIEDATSARDAVPAAAHVERLERRGAPLRAWMDAVRAIGRNDAGYRDVAIGPTALALVLDDPRMSAGARIGAAAALVAAEPSATERVTAAAHACADDDLRDALIAVADERWNAEAIDLATREPMSRPRRSQAPGA